MSLKMKIFLFLIMNGFYFFSYFHRVGIPGTIFNEIQMDFHLTANQVAGLGAIVFYIYGFLQFFIGPCLDYFGTNRIFVTGGFLLCVGSFLFSFAHSVFFLFFSRVLVGFGASVAYLGIVKKTDELFGRDFFSLMLGIALFLGYSGGLFATLPFERMVNFFGWRQTMLVLSVILFLIMIFTLFAFIKNHQFSYKKNTMSFIDIKQILLNREMYPVIFSAAINFTVYFIFQSIIGKKLLQDTCGVTSKIAASFTLFMMVSTMLFVLFWGTVTHIAKTRKSLIVFLCLISMISCVMMLANFGIWKHPVIFLLCFFIFAIVGGSGPLTTTLIKEFNPSGVGTSVGFINGICYIFVAISGNICGFIMDRFSSKAVITKEAVVYPVDAYVVIVGLCTFISFLAFLSSLRITEPETKVKTEIPEPF